MFKKAKIVLAALTLLVPLAVVWAVSTPQATYAIVCPDGTTVPDAQADECGKTIGNQACKDAVAGTPSAEGCAVDLDPVNTGDKQGKFVCGKGENNEVKVAFNFGCVGGTDKYTGANLNPIVDIAFALFRFLSAGVGIVVIGSIIVAGIQYTTSRGEPQATQAAIKRIANSLIALLIYIFMFAIANFLVPGGMFI